MFKNGIPPTINWSSGGGGGGGETTYAVAASADDGVFTATNQSSSFPSGFIVLGNSATDAKTLRERDEDFGMYTYTKAFFRFQNINISQGATIQSAYLKVVYYSGTGTTDLKIVGTDADNASAPTHASDGATSLHTSAVVSWSNPSTHSTNYQTSPDIKTVIQEIVDRGSWASGNAMMIQTYYDSGGSTKQERKARTYDYSSAAYPAKLVITI
tara:strand:- start:436 stop:1074 length:639 start_codon:yes stop_codon:yes gene_type:complete